MFVHPGDPYHRLDVLPSSRHVRISLDGELLAESRNAIALFESNLPTRWYLAREDVHAHLVPVDTVTRCGYKGTAAYYSVQLAGGGIAENLVWSYAQPFDGARRIAIASASSTSRSISRWTTNSRHVRRRPGAAASAMRSKGPSRTLKLLDVVNAAIAAGVEEQRQPLWVVADVEHFTNEDVVVARLVLRV